MRHELKIKRIPPEGKRYTQGYCEKVDYIGSNRKGGIIFEGELKTQRTPRSYREVRSIGKFQVFQNPDGKVILRIENNDGEVAEIEG
jgi:hypothetical protein